MMIKRLLLPVLILSSLAGPAQSLLIPAENAFEKKWIGNTHYQMTWFAVKDTALMEIGKVKTSIAAGDKYLVVVTRVSLKNATSPWTDSTIADLKTLTPVRHSSYNMQRDMVLEFGKIITGYYDDKVKNKRTLISDTAMGGYFDSNLYPALIGWLPLGENYKQDISIYDYNPYGKTGVIKASVTGVASGTFQSEKKGTRNVWVVAVSDEIGNGTNTYYFDKEDRTLWKQEINVNGRKMLMKLAE
ncbi:MAG: hypothetical protein U0U70_17615 [Chitinophagaceae bacterium]